MSHCQNAGRSHNTETAIAFFEDVGKPKYVEASNQNYVHRGEKIKFRGMTDIIRFRFFQFPASYLKTLGILTVNSINQRHELD
jgi:hypothetical protein